MEQLLRIQGCRIYEECWYLLNVSVVLDVTVGGRTSVTTPTTVEVRRTVRNARKIHIKRIVPATGATVTSARAVTAHVVDYSIHVNPQQRQTSNANVSVHLPTEAQEPSSFYCLPDGICMSCVYLLWTFARANLLRTCYGLTTGKQRGNCGVGKVCLNLPSS